ncbi:MAG: hypothetical protein JWP12_898 [Bacteroidetes bacterium]|nr:hypothetical protein [Bacteroidota bacterium]
MERIFPFKNIAINSFLSFSENRFFDYYFWEYKQRNNDYYKDLVEDEILHFRDALTNFENEVLQIINTTNQETIDVFFKELKANIDYVKQYGEEKLMKIINDYNYNINEAFEEKIKKSSEEYFKKEERTKYKHLEKYTFQQLDYYSLGSFRSKPATKIEMINYNFYCIESFPEVIDLNYFYDYNDLVKTLRIELIAFAEKYITLYDQGKVKANVEIFFNKTIVYVEGEHDIQYIVTAAGHLDFEKTLDKIELRQRNGYRNLDKIWEFYKSNSLELIAQKKILLYDCDTQKQDSDFGNYLFKRTIPTFNGHLIGKGIENLFSNYTVQKAIKEKKEFIDFNTKKGTIRGIDYYEELNEVNKDEKANFCKWICNNGTKEDFKNFEIVFKIINNILESNIQQ